MTITKADTDAILSVALRLGATRTLGELVPVVLAALVEVLGAERALFVVFDEDGQVEDAATHHLSWEPGTPLAISNSILSDVLRTGLTQELVSPDFGGQAPGRDSVRRLALRFVVAVPVFDRGTVRGVLYADSQASVRPEGARSSDVLGALSGIVGLALENARLAAEQQLRTILVAKLVHDLRSPLMAIQLAAECLRDDAGSDPETVQDIHYAARSMQASCQSAIRFAGIEGAPAEPASATVGLDGLVEEMARMYAGAAAEYGLRLESVIEAGLPPIRTWPERVRLVLDNLIANALRHARSGTVIRIFLVSRGDAGPPTRTPPRSGMARLFRSVARLSPNVGTPYVELAVHNDGPPIPPDLLPRVLDEGVRGASAARGLPSSGLGLTIVEQCVSTLGGRVWVISGASEGTRVSFTLPVRSQASGDGDGE